MSTAVALFASVLVGARKTNNLKNQASVFQLTGGVGHGESKQTNENASEQLVLIKGMLPETLGVQFCGAQSSLHLALTAYTDCVLLFSL